MTRRVVRLEFDTHRSSGDLVDDISVVLQAAYEIEGGEGSSPLTGLRLVMCGTQWHRFPTEGQVNYPAHSTNDDGSISCP